MNDDPINELSPEEGAAALPAAAKAALGQRLRAAREAQGLSAQDVADDLKIGVRKVAAIEAEHWEQLPKPPFLRGFVRNYAKILNLDGTRLYEEFDALVGEGEKPADFNLKPSLRTPFPQRTRGAHDSGLSRFMRVSTLLLVVVAALIGWSGTESFHRSEEIMTSWLADRARPQPIQPAAPEPITHEPITNEPVPAAAGGAMSSGLATQPAAADPNGPAQRSAAAQSSPAANAAPLTLASVSTILVPVDNANLSGDLILRFNDDSWVEVRQADGKILMSQLNHAGAGKALDGAPPLELVIGNAPGVALQYHGSAVDLAPFTRDRVARLTLK